MRPLQFVLIYAVGIVVILYFSIILPGKRKNKKTQQMHEAVKPGDTISTIGGIIGTVTARDGDTVFARIDDNNGTIMRIVIYAVQSIIESAEV